MKLFKWLYKTRTAKQNNNSNLENNSSKVIDKIPKVKNKTQDLWNVWNFEYQAYWSDGNIEFWDINRQGWHRNIDQTVVLKSLDNLSDICKDSLNEIKSHLQIYLWCIVPCYGLTQDPIIGDYMMVLKYCKGGNLQNFIQSKNTLYYDKIYGLSQIARGLYDIHNVGKVHKDFHSGNILFNSIPYISDLGMCQPVNESKQSEGIYGVLPYIAPEVLRGYQYVKASDIYSFGIVMNEYLSEKIPYCNVPHDDILAVKICKGLRPKIANETPNLLSDLIKKCLDAKVGNRPTAKELYQTLEKLSNEQLNPNSDIYAQIEECKRIRANMFQNESNESQPKSIQTHSQAIYTSRLLNFKNLPDPVNSYPCKICTVSECLDTQISEDISF
ncbi:8495_t:CDS:2 [Funneliformis geosporum]|nr:8495_t:CDS:2 [Funneliformis geosporum]